ncbi:MAG: hypothetical protein ACXACB_00015 [Promethearchaeota archaeon]
MKRGRDEVAWFKKGIFSTSLVAFSPFFRKSFYFHPHVCTEHPKRWKNLNRIQYKHNLGVGVQSE